MLKAVPKQKRRIENWQAARQALLCAGFEQTTLTNFERAKVARSKRRFVYEPMSFIPDQYDAVGYGPAAISTFSDGNMSGGVTLANTSDSSEYLSAIRRTGGAWSRRFNYAGQDMRLLFVTSSIPSQKVSRPAYRSLFGSDLVDDFADVINALDRQQLIRLDVSQVALTDRDMFFADSVAGLFASSLVHGSNEGVAQARNTKDT